MPTRRQKVQLGLLTALALASLAYGAYRWWLSTPPPMPQTIEQAVAVIQDPRFAQLPESRRADYMRRSRELYEKLDPAKQQALRETIRGDETARKAVGAAMREQMLTRAREYEKASPEDRTKLLDQVIAAQSAMELASRFRSAAKNEGKPSKEEDARRTERQRQMQEMIEKGDPQRQAYVGEFFKALRERRMEKGLSPEPAIRR